MNKLITNIGVRRGKLTTQYDAIVYFISMLDIEMVDAFLDEDISYQDFSKKTFVHKLGAALEQYKQLAQNVNSIHNGECVGCNKGCKGLTFLSENGCYMDIIFKIENNRIIDMFDCSSFENDELGLVKLKNIEIDPLDLIFQE